MKRTFVSFDVFDTCLIRRCGRPEKIWDLMAERLFDKDDNRGRMSFVGNRSIVEENLRNLGNVHATLDDIYTELRTEQWNYSKEKLMQFEMDVEEQELFPNPELLKMVEDYRSKGFVITFISDMYLPSAFIKRLLTKHGFCCEKDLVFVSAESKGSKYDGSLFEYVFDKTGTKAKQWIHYGDHKRSDYYVPKSKGVKAYWISNTDFTNEEKRWLLDARFYSHKHAVELWAGLCRLVRIQNERSERATMAIDFIASNYVPYVIWTLETARKKGINKLFFLGRDGHIFYEIAKSFKEKFYEIQISYLKISRKAIFSCVFVEGSNFEFESTVGTAGNRLVKDYLYQIGIEYELLSEETKKQYALYDKLSNKQRASFVECLKENDLTTILESAKEKRKLLIEYLEQEGVLSESHSALVDLGWYGSSRCNLNYILRKMNRNILPTFYWGVCDFVTYGQSSDLLFIFQRQYGFLKKVTPMVSVFMEHYASMNAAGSTIAYEKCGTRVNPVEDLQLLNIQAWQDSNERMCSLIASSLNVTWDEEALTDVFLCCGLKNLECLLHEPSSFAIRFFSQLYVENFDKRSKFICRLDLKNILALLVWGMTVKPVWLKASIGRTFGILETLFERLYLFTSKTSFAMKLRLWWDGRK